MSFFDALLLGIVQGLTEFLPVSSSGHLALFTAMLGGDSLPKENLLFTMLVHGATALATIIVFRKDILKIFQGVFKKEDTGSRHFVGHILVSMIPAVGIGLFLEEEITALFGSNLALVGAMLFITALLLFFTDRTKAKNQTITYNIAFLIGVAQAIAILPGISRSGATIATALLIGTSRPEAARFSFLMVIPLIFGSMAKTLLENGLEVFGTVNLLSLVVGFTAALISGVVACTWMIALVKRSKLRYFAIYCLIIGLTASFVAWI
jgi:undecaprenyl-diphosphatase